VKKIGEADGLVVGSSGESSDRAVTKLYDEESNLGSCR